MMPQGGYSNRSLNAKEISTVIVNNETILKFYIVPVALQEQGQLKVIALSVMISSGNLQPLMFWNFLWLGYTRANHCIT